MKNLKFLLLIVMIFNVINTFSQKTKTNRLSQDKNILVVFNNKLVQRDLLTNIKQTDIDQLKVLKAVEGIAKYGEKAKNGVIEVVSQNLSKAEVQDLQLLYALEFSNDVKEKKTIVIGNVTDCEKATLPGVLIKNLNTKDTVFSDLEGNFKIATNKNNVLEFSFFGFQSQRFLVKKEAKISIQLKEIPDMTKGEIRVLKPIIYLYPVEKTDVSIQFEFKGKLQTTFPEYKQKWEVIAYPNGQLFEKNTKRFYNSLFWDGEINHPDKHFDYKTGFVVSKNDLTSFLIEKLEFMGLNNNETNDFVQYWLPILEKNNFSFIHFLVNKDYNVISNNYVTPSPTTSIRIFMEFYGLKSSISIPDQKLEKTERKGFTLVEWGGSDVSSKMKTINNIN